MSEAVAWDEGFDACRDGVKRRNPYQPLPGAAAVPEAEDGRAMDPLLSAPMARMAALDDKAAGQYARVNPDWLVALIDLATSVSAVPARDDERERLAALLAAIDYDDDAWDKQHSATWNYREWLDRIDAAAAPIRAVLAAAPLPEGQEGDR